MEFSGERYIPGIGGNIALEHEHRYRLCLDLVAGRKVLDIASGEGFGTAMLSTRAEFVWGVDISSEAVRHASQKYDGVNIRFLTGSCSAIPLPDSSVDVVVSFETIEHHDQHTEMLLEIRRVLKCGGALVISSPDKRTYSDQRNFQNKFHIKELYAAEFEALLRSNFHHVMIFGQRIIYGSAILLLEGSGEISSYGIDRVEPSSGIHDPLFQVAVASDSPALLKHFRGGLFEETIYKSEPIIERAMMAEREKQALREAAAESEQKHTLSENKLLELQASNGLANQKLLKLEEERALMKATLLDITNASALANNRLREMEKTINLANKKLLELQEEYTLLSEEAKRQSHLPACHWEELQKTLASQKVALARNPELTAELNRLSRAYYSGNFIRRIVFHKNGRPRSWFKNLIWDKRHNRARKYTNMLLFKNDGSVRSDFAKWYNAKINNQITRKEQFDYTNFLIDRIQAGALTQAKSLQIITTPHTEYIGEAVCAALSSTRLQASRSNSMPALFEHDLYIVVAPQMFKTLPPPEKRIVVQMEQVRASPWMTEEYLDVLLHSLAVWDYSLDNIEALMDRGIPFKQLYYIPILPSRLANGSNADRDIDILFYGSIASERRGRYLNALRDRHNIQIVSETFGQELQDILSRTKVVVNIHYYENALLETTRISEALSYGANVVSEEGIDQVDHGYFDGLVSFVRPGDINAFVDEVTSSLQNWNGPADIPRDNGFAGMPFHIIRALNGIEVLSLDEVVSACGEMEAPSDRIILCLPEQRHRYNYALSHRLPRAIPFHGLRNIVGWKGCANSYKFIANVALSSGLGRCTIYEEDASFSEDAVERLERIERYLDRGGDRWDIFSGLLSDLNPNAQISRIEMIDSEEFIHLNSVIGMVFNIYNRRGLEMLAEFEFGGTDTAKHTIDRYLEHRRPYTITVWPCLVGHNEELHSTLWPVRNNVVNPMIEQSLSQLNEKRAKFLGSGLIDQSQ